MVRLADVRRGHAVLDPCCGAATLLIEAHHTVRRAPARCRPRRRRVAGSYDQLARCAAPPDPGRRGQPATRRRQRRSHAGESALVGAGRCLHAVSWWTSPIACGPKRGVCCSVAAGWPHSFMADARYVPLSSTDSWLRPPAPSECPVPSPRWSSRGSARLSSTEGGRNPQARVCAPAGSGIIHSCCPTALDGVARYRTTR
jgi:hypothetical protein